MAPLNYWNEFLILRLINHWYFHSGGQDIFIPAKNIEKNIKLWSM